MASVWGIQGHGYWVGGECVCVPHLQGQEWGLVLGGQATQVLAQWRPLSWHLEEDGR